MSRGAIAGLFPGYFALVMATGIIATAAELEDLDVVADVLFVVTAGAYVVLCVLLVTRLVRYPARLFADLTSHSKGFAFLTTVAGTNVLGSAAGVIHGWWTVAWIMWTVGLVLWVVLVYTTLIAVVLRSEKPGLGSGINGTWFLVTVATESIAVLGGLLLARPDRDGGDLLAFACLAMFTLGVV
ncbi:MAG: C4-dicarboxylate ABC transporter, partial [Ilumatobacteraceae bacterium]